MSQNKYSITTNEWTVLWYWCHIFLFENRRFFV